MATRFSATAAAIGLAAGALAGLSAGAAGAAAHPYAPTELSALPFSVAGPATAVPVTGPPEAALDVPGAPAGTWPARNALTVGLPIGLPAFAADEYEHVAPAKPTKRPTTQPFHKTGRKARSLPDTGLPMSAALGAVTALTALLAGIGTVRAAGRGTDHES